MVRFGFFGLKNSGNIPNVRWPNYYYNVGGTLGSFLRSKSTEASDYFFVMKKNLFEIAYIAICVFLLTNNYIYKNCSFDHTFGTQGFDIYLCVQTRVGKGEAELHQAEGVVTVLPNE